MILTSATDLFDPDAWSVPVDSVLASAAILGIAVAIALVAHRVAFGIIRRATAHGPGKYGQPIFDAVRAPSRWLAAAISAASRRFAPRCLG